jgi:hypothetical protein
MKSKLEELKLDSLILQEDMASLQAEEPSGLLTVEAAASDYTFGIRAKAIKKG